MRRWRVITLVLMVLLGVATPARAALQPRSTAVGPGDVYLALGDSLATGYEEPANADGQPGYPEGIAAALRAEQPSLALVNLGRDGESSASMVSGGQLDAAVLAIRQQQAAGKKVGLVTLSIGGNDIARIIPPPFNEGANPAATLAVFTTNLGTILDQLLAAITVDGVRQADLVVMDYYNPYPGFAIPPPFGDGQRLADIWVPQFNAAIGEVAAARGIPVAQAAQAVAGREAELLYVTRPYYIPSSPTDPAIAARYDYHPRPAGHAVLADAFLKAAGYRAVPQALLPLLVR